MKLKKSECIAFFKMIIDNNGRPSTKQLVDRFGYIIGHEMSRRLYLGDYALYTSEQLVNVASVALERLL